MNHLECVPFSSSKSPEVFGRTIFVGRFRWFLAWINDMLLSWTILNYLILTSPPPRWTLTRRRFREAWHPNCQEPGAGNPIAIRWTSAFQPPIKSSITFWSCHVKHTFNNVQPGHSTTTYFCLWQPVNHTPAACIYPKNFKRKGDLSFRGRANQRLGLVVIPKCFL